MARYRNIHTNAEIESQSQLLGAWEPILELGDHSIAELKEKLDEKGVKYKAKATKAELVELLK